MKKNLKIISVITVLLLSLVIMPMKVFATGDLTLPNPIPVENNQGGTTTGGGSDVTTGAGTGETTGGSTDLVEDKVAEDKVADDKVLPDAGFDQSMIYIIAALVLFAVFAYFKVVKYNLD